MFAGRDRGKTREVFFRAWSAWRQGRPLEGVEKLIVQVALRHPEYHALLERPDDLRERDFSPASGETNPFLHLGMHIAIEEQLALGQPAGIRDYYRIMLNRLPDDHAVQHRIMECLEEILWQADRRTAAQQEATYLECLRRLADTFS